MLNAKGMPENLINDIEWLWKLLLNQKMQIMHLNAMFA
jgi:hypothetical protein